MVQGLRETMRHRLNHKVHLSPQRYLRSEGYTCPCKISCHPNDVVLYKFQVEVNDGAIKEHELRIEALRFRESKLRILRAIKFREDIR